MASIKVVLWLLLLCLCGGCSLGDLDTPSSGSTSPPVANSDQFLRQLLDVLETCSRPPPGSDYNNPVVLCSTLPHIRECFLREEIKWNQTHREVLNTVYVIYRELWENTIDRLCDNTEKLTDLVNEIKELIKNISNSSKDMLILKCFFYGNIARVTVDKSQADVASKVWYYYHHLKNLRECLIKYGNHHENVVNFVENEISTALEGMKCLQPLDNSVVPCKDVDNTLIDREHICPMSNKIPSGQGLTEALVLNSIRCFRANSYEPSLSSAQSLEQFQQYFDKYCKSKERFTHCQPETNLVADMCLTERDFEKFKLVSFYLDLVHHTGCFQEGIRLATLFYRFHVIRNSTGGPVDCLHGTLVANGESLDVYSYYKELPVIKQCILEKASEDTAFQTVLDEMFHEIRDGMKCLNPKDETVVLCKHISKR